MLIRVQLNSVCKSENESRLLCAVGQWFNRHFPHNVGRLFESRHTETHQDTPRHTLRPRGTHPTAHSPTLTHTHRHTHTDTQTHAYTHAHMLV